MHIAPGGGCQLPGGKEKEDALGWGDEQQEEPLRQVHWPLPKALKSGILP